MPKFTYIRDTTVQKVIIESEYKHYISDKITKVAEPGETYTVTGLFWNKKKVATERLYSIGLGLFGEVMTRQQIINEYGVDPEDLQSDLEYTATIYYASDRIIKTADDMKTIMDWINNTCPDFENLIEIKSEL